MPVAENLSEIKKRIPRHVTLVAVSKTKPVEMIKAAYDAGQRDFGENYVQELVEKQALLPHDIRWHFIGHLQSNKVKYIAPFVHLIHGVDSLKLLKEIGKQAVKQNRTIDVLLQLHVAREETKFGLTFDECRALLEQLEKEPVAGVRVKGFMAMASNTGDRDQVKNEFLSVQKFQQELLPQFPGLSVLSYGMSGDFGEAIACGSNMVRVGSLIFGERQ